MKTIDIRIFSLLWLGIIAISCLSYSQNAIADYSAGVSLLQNIIPPSPEAASMGKYGDIPVNTYTGLPSIDVPIYTLAGRNLQVPVSLSYYAGGIKVDEIASRVGLGWSLNAGGVITRSVRGLPDEIEGGYLEVSHQGGLQKYGFADLESLSRPKVYDLDGKCPDVDDSFTKALRIYQSVANNQLDLEPDIYYVNFPGYSGRIMIDRLEDKMKGHAINIPYTDANIVFEMGVNAGRRMVERWKITTTEGITYIFGRSWANQELEAIEYTQVNQVGGSRDPNFREISRYPSAWYLTEIIAPEVPSDPSQISAYDDIIHFDYEPYTLKLPELRYAESRRICLSCEDIPAQPLENISSYIHETEGVMLKRIESLTGSIEFQYAKAPREDHPQGSTDRALESIDIYGFKGEKSQNFQLQTGYFTNGVGNTHLPAQPWQRKRLKLLSIQQIGKDMRQDQPNPYIFSYFDQYPLPAVNSFAMDYWGFYNGQTENTTLIPEIKVNETVYHSPANRKPDISYMKLGTLSSITYPTGGSTRFDYEPHETYSHFNFDLVEPIYETIDIINEVPPVRMNEFNISDTITNPNNPQEKGDYIKVSVRTEIECQPQPGIGDNICPCDDANTDENSLCTATLEIFRRGSRLPFKAKNISNGVIEYFLPNGDYTWKLSETRVDPTGVVRKNISGTLYILKEPEPGTSSNQVVGGLRIAAIRHSDGENPEKDQVIKYSYQDQKNPGISSGVLISYPVYTYIQEAWNSNQAKNSYLIISASSHAPLATAQGSWVAYKDVAIKYENVDGTKSRGKTQRTYNVRRDLVDRIYPFRPSFNRNDIIRGQLLRETQMKSIDSDLSQTRIKTYEPVSATQHSYTYQFKQNQRGIKLGCKVTGLNICQLPQESSWRGPECSEIIFDLYTVQSGWNQSDTAVHIQYYGSGDSTLQQSLFFYESTYHTQQTRSVTMHPNRTYATHHIYSIEASSFFDQELIEKFRRKNIIIPVQRQQYEGSKAGNLTQVSGKRLYWNDWGDAQHPILKPEQIHIFETTDPGTGSYAPRAEMKYEGDYGLLIQQTHINSALQSSYLWGYHYLRPVAQIQGASYDDAISRLDVEILISPESDEILRTELNKLRKDFPQALITTYTYDEQLQVRSVTGPDGVTVYYQYDSLGRLIEARNDDRELIKEIEYHYQK